MTDHTARPDKSPADYDGAKINKNALKMQLYERGFLGADVTMEDRDTALVNPHGIPEPRREVFDVFAENYSWFQKTDNDEWPWMVEI